MSSYIRQDIVRDKCFIVGASDAWTGLIGLSLAVQETDFQSPDGADPSTPSV